MVFKGIVEYASINTTYEQAEGGLESSHTCDLLEPGARRRTLPFDWGLECGASLLPRSLGGLLLPTAGKRVGYQTPPLLGHLRPSRYGGLSPPPLPLMVADALKHQCVGGSLCPGVGVQTAAMANQEINRREEFLKTQQGFRKNAYKIIDEMNGWSNNTAGSTHLVDEILHSILFLGKINKTPFSPNEIFSSDDILQALMEKYPRPFQFYLTQLPRRSPFSCVLDMIVLRENPENEEQIKQSLRELISDLAPQFLVSSIICISQKSNTDQSSKRYYGVSMSTNGPNPGKIVIGASCLNNWDEYVSGAVMTYYPNNNEKKAYFDGTIEVPGNIRCESFSLSRDEQMSPCKSCHNLFGLNTEETKKWAYGNCAEPESLSNLLKNEEEVKNGTTVHDRSAENRQRAEEEVRQDLQAVLRMIHFNTWSGEFYNPESE
ncbi:uncharacterized protein LOC102778482 [Neolamprologus brichardi]|uniref:uncharacterized protein LOC102778482 n=1 Tax=Neolamprologus brichardi TaxID=32507 RepID=UPI00164396E6|nr:uncharacterized protein LOC102778482 [Neolamprologus brichardi]